MTLALIDCPTGLAGNMLLAALLDLGLPEAVIHGPLEAPLAMLALAPRPAPPAPAPPWLGWRLSTRRCGPAPSSERTATV